MATNPASMPHDSVDSKATSQEEGIYLSEQTEKGGLIQVTATEIRMPRRAWRMADVTSVKCERKDNWHLKVFLKVFNIFTILLGIGAVVILVTDILRLIETKGHNGPGVSIMAAGQIGLFILANYMAPRMVSGFLVRSEVSLCMTDGTTESFSCGDKDGLWSRIADAANQVISERSEDNL